MDRLERARRDVVIANRILAQQKVLDAYGHVSIRHPDDPNKYLLARSCSPGIVDVDDIVEFHLDGAPTGPEKRPLYLERFIHGAVYERRPDVKAVLHSHADDLLPFSISKTMRLRPVIHACGDMGQDIPVWDIARNFGNATSLLVLNMEHGRDLAQSLAGHRMALMAAHGFVCTGRSIYDLVRLAVYIPRNARVQMQASMMGEYRVIAPGETQARLDLDPDSPALKRGWEFWGREAGCGALLED
jgi:HCOMODA/2-hydroxy-3-carboxy-muconic semialdehyde decarboxylase